MLLGLGLGIPYRRRYMNSVLAPCLDFLNFWEGVNLDTEVVNKVENGTNGLLINSNCLTFNGIDNYIKPDRIPYLLNTTNPWKIKTWIKLNALGSAQPLLADYKNTGFLISITGGDTLQVVLRKTSGTDDLLVRSVYTFTTDWTFLEIEYDGSKDQTGIIIKINGVTSAKTLVSNTLTTDDITDITSTGLYIGASVDQAAYNNITLACFQMFDQSNINIFNYSFSEGSGIKVYEKISNNEYIVQGTLSNIWDNKQDVFHNNLLNGFTQGLYCVSSGTSYKEFTQAYGVWEFDFCNGNTVNNTYLNIITDTKATFGGDGGGYMMYVNGNEQLGLYKNNPNGSGSVLMVSSFGYIATNQVFRFKIERLISGEFSIYVKGGTFGNEYVLMSPITGTNPVIDNTYTISNYLVIDNDSSDSISNLKVNNSVVNLFDFEDITGVYDKIYLPVDPTNTNESLTNPAISDGHNGAETVFLLESARDEKVKNGTFETDLTDWIDGNIEGTIVWNPVKAVDIARNAGNGANILFQIGSYVEGRTYNISIDILAASHALRFKMGSQSLLLTSNGETGSYSFDYLCTANTSNITIDLLNSTVATATVANISIIGGYEYEYNSTAGLNDTIFRRDLYNSGSEKIGEDRILNYSTAPSGSCLLKTLKYVGLSIIPALFFSAAENSQYLGLF